MAMDAISEKVREILDERRKRLPEVQARIDAWTKVESALGELDTAKDNLAKDDRVPPDIRAQLQDVRFSGVLAEVSTAKEAMARVAARFRRETVNVGVSGRAQVGKSTLLRGISGLSSDVIPTGTKNGQPRTATRSRIYHSSTRQQATVEFHTFGSFREEVLRPFHEGLGLTAVPETIDAFRRFAYPADGSEVHAPAVGRDEATAWLQRLKEIQAALDSYQDQLTGGECVFQLPQEQDKLKPYVVYPEGADSRIRPYLAAREVVIECRFPYARVERLGLVDLPGLGEVLPQFEQRHVKGLRDDVDLVLLLKHPLTGMGSWDKGDVQACKLLEEARGAVKLQRDFVFIVINSGGLPVETKREMVVGCEASILKYANEGKDGVNYRVLKADVAREDEVNGSVLQPLLFHLAARLPVMDAEVLDSANRICTALAGRVRAALVELDKPWQQLQPQLGTLGDALRKKADDLHKDVCDTLLLGVLTKYTRDVIDSSVDPEFVEAVAAVRRELDAWIDDGFGTGSDAWCEDTRKTANRDGDPNKRVTDELNRVRAEIRRRFAKLDTELGNRRAAFLEEIRAALGQHLGAMIEAPGEAGLRQLQALLEQEPQACRGLAAAVGRLLEFRMEFRTHIDPHLAAVWDTFRQAEDIPKPPAKPPFPAEYAKYLCTDLQLRAKGACYAAYKQIVTRKEAPAKFLLPALTEFEDSFIRFGPQAANEFAQLVLKYHNRIWPNLAELTLGDPHIADFTKAREHLQVALRQTGAESHAKE